MKSLSRKAWYEWRRSMRLVDPGEYRRAMARFLRTERGCDLPTDREYFGMLRTQGCPESPSEFAGAARPPLPGEPLPRAEEWAWNVDPDAGRATTEPAVRVPPRHTIDDNEDRPYTALARRQRET